MTESTEVAVVAAVTVLMTAEEGEALGQAIAAGVTNLFELVEQARVGEPWRAMGINGLKGWLYHYVDTDHLRIPPGERNALFKSLTGAGLSYREIEEVTGASTATISRALNPVTNVTPPSAPPDILAEDDKEDDYCPPPLVQTPGEIAMGQLFKFRVSQRGLPIDAVVGHLNSLQAGVHSALALPTLVEECDDLTDEGRTAMLVILREAHTDLGSVISQLGWEAGEASA